MTTSATRLALVLAAACAACNSPSASEPPPPAPPPPPADTTRPPADTLPRTFVGRMVFIAPGGWLTAMDTENGATARLGIRGYFHHISPDGRFLVYTTPDETIALLDLATRAHTVLQAARRSIAPRWSPDGSRILFWSNRTGRPQLWIMNADGSAATRITDNAGGENLEGDWSPDGSRIAFRRCEGSGPGACNIWLINADGTQMRPLSTAERQDQNPRWSPDGTRIALVRLTGPAGATNWDIWMMAADGTGLTRLTSHPDDEWAPAWTPDGRRIAFFRYNNTAQVSDIFTVTPDGSELTHLLTGPEQPVYGPARP
jgi:Tol biopolymer transport system component